jgi:hypothetical protein
VNKDVGVWIAAVVMTIVLFWGLRVIAWALMRAPNPVPVSQDEERLHRTAQPLAYTVLAERPDPDTGDFKGSFSRTVGAFGAMVLAASLAGISYWIIFDLFEDAGSNLAKLQSTGWYFLVGTVCTLRFQSTFKDIQSSRAISMTDRRSEADDQQAVEKLVAREGLE